MHTQPDSSNSRNPSEASRRDMLKRGVLGAAALGLVTTPGLAQDSDTAEKTPRELSRDQQAVRAAGMTDAEADCWQKTAEAAAAFFQLPELHPKDNEEAATAIHIIQNKILTRPTYRKYLEFHKAQQQDSDK